MILNFSKNNIINVLQRSLDALIISTLFILPWYFDFFKSNYNTFDLPKQVLLRSLVLVIGLIFLSKILISNRLELVKGYGKYWLYLSLFIGNILFGIFFVTTQPIISTFGSYERCQGLISHLAYWLFFVLLLLNLKTKEQLINIIKVLVIGSILVCWYGLLQAFGFDFLFWQESIQARIISSMGQPNFLGHYLVLVIPITIFSLFNIFKTKVSRFFIGSLLLTQLMCLIFTYSRSAWLGLLVVVTMFAVVVMIVNRKSCKKYLTSLLVVLVLIISFNLVNQILEKTSLPNLSLGIQQRLSFTAEGSTTIKIRMLYWESAINEFSKTSWKHRLFGYGLESQASVFMRYYQPEWARYEVINSFPDRAHNIIFDNWLQFGLIGWLLLLLLIGRILIDSFKYIKSTSDEFNKWLVITLWLALVAYFINNLFSFSLTTHFLLLWTYLALIIFIINSPKNFIVISFSFLRFSIKLLIISTSFLLSNYVIYYYNFAFLIADIKYTNALESELGSDCQGIVNNINQAISWNPYQNYFKEKSLRMKSNCFDIISPESKKSLAEDIIYDLESMPKEEYQYYSWLNGARASEKLCSLGFLPYCELVDKNYQALIKLNPNISVNYQDYGKFKFSQKKYVEAIALYDLSMPGLLAVVDKSLQSKYIVFQLVKFYELKAEAYVKLGKYSEAISEYQAAIKLDKKSYNYYKKIADLFFMQADYQQAIKFNKLGLDSNPSDTTWSLSLSLLYDIVNDKERSLYYAQRVLRLDAGNKEALKLEKKLSK